MVDQVFEWLLAPRHLKPPSTQVFPGQEDRVRRCASMEGLALWYLHELGLADDRADLLASRLVGWQWPDGGWNCDRNQDARHSSFHETVTPAIGLAHFALGVASVPGEGAAGATVDTTVDIAGFSNP